MFKMRACISQCRVLRTPVFFNRATTSFAVSSRPCFVQCKAPTPSTPATNAQVHQDISSEALKEEYVVVNFYHLVDIEHPGRLVGESKEFLEDRDVRGRIYFSHQGINAQYGGLRQDAVAYANWLPEKHPELFSGLKYSVDEVEGHMFPKMRLKYRPNLISLAGGMAALPITEAEARATPVEPSKWKDMLAQAEKLEPRHRPIVLDVRNSYEWDAGHFVGAERPLEEEFNETPTEATPLEIPLPLQEIDPETPVMMYCTGGIRCDVYSTYLKAKGFKNLYTLEGGIQNYMKNQGLEYWNGSLFVFDGRMAIRPDGSGKESERAETLPAASPCQICGGTAVLPHANCANIDCNALFISCDACKQDLKGCCCNECMKAPRLLRPMKTVGLYGNWTQYIDSDAEDAAMKIANGRGDGRLSRRHKRLAAVREKQKLIRDEKMERRRTVRAMIASTSQKSKQEETNSPERLARLRELREHLNLKGSVKA